MGEQHKQEAVCLRRDQAKVPSPEGHANQFTIKGLLIVTTMMAFSLIPTSIMGVEGIPASICTLFLMLIVYLFYSHREFWIAGGLLLLLAGLLIPSTTVVKGPAKRTSCLNNMRQIVLAMHNFESARGHLPPAFTTDANGNPLHSWRVLLLPFLECNHLYDKIDLNKSWNHPVNIALHDQMPEVFRCPGAKTKPFETTYLALAGDDMVWSLDGTPRTFQDVTDGCSNTICLIESSDHPVHWMSPHNPSYDQFAKRIGRMTNRKGGSSMFSGHAVGGNVALCDGSCCFHNESLTPENMKSWLTHNAEDHVDFE